MNPSVFTGTKKDEDPQDYIDALQKIFRIMAVIETEAATFGAHQVAFLDHFMPVELREAKAEQFLKLKQNGRPVQEYYLEFVSLAKHAPHMVPDIRARVRRFVGGLDSHLCGQKGHFLRDCPSARQGTGGNMTPSINSAVPRNNQAQQGNNAVRSGNTSGGRNRMYALTGRQDTEARADVVTDTLTVFTFDIEVEGVEEHWDTLKGGKLRYAGGLFPVSMFFSQAHGRGFID
ncbi:uncharacterized protein LOC132613332 [Lycium barbarum]|uniref:uncharacterized protein LOC132613332 n=1 Tax=Lycium barbarum TaxID=112863 RepID=UPI00293F2B12|nr:uncharacterized protein LOC132613332 [Lycium barbarum]